MGCVHFWKGAFIRGAIYSMVQKEPENTNFEDFDAQPYEYSKAKIMVFDRASHQIYFHDFKIDK